MGILLIDDQDNTVFEHEGFKTALETGKEDMPEFAHKIIGLGEDEFDKEKKEIKKSNTAIIAMIIGLVLIVGFMIFQNFQESQK